MQKLKFNIIILFVLLLAGCASIPPKTAFPTYDINGAAYFSLVPFCKSQGISWDYDTYTRNMAISKGVSRINLHVGDKLIIVNGQPQYLKHPVEIYEGTVAVPYRFKEQFLDNLVRETPSIQRKLTPLKIKKIVIDAGHGGNDPGAVGRNGLREKDVNLDIAKRVAELLKKEGVEVVFTRSIDKAVSLENRVDIANKSGADLFLSIHSNANRVRSLNGFEVYYVSPTANDSQRAVSAAKESDLRLAGLNLTGASFTLKAILWDMIHNYNRAQSIELSRDICRTMDEKMDLKILGVKNARFYVLIGARMPAVLIEVGFVSNSKEEKSLKNYYYRQKIAEGITEGVFDYARPALAGIRE